MPITFTPGQPWPPREEGKARDLYDEYGAWFSGDPVALWSYYTRHPTAAYPQVRPSQLRGGIQGFIARMWWGRPLTPGQSTTHIHVPAPSDLSSISRSLLFAEPPQIELPDHDQQVAADDGTIDTTNPAQDWLRKALKDSGALAAMSEGAEFASAYGGCYLRASANTDVCPWPIIEAIMPEGAVPEWAPGPTLRAVTFWRVVNDPQYTTGELSQGARLRHLERHEMQNGKCVVYHGLYSGSLSSLGRLVPLEDGDAECQRLAGLVDEQGMIEVGTTRLDVAYWPNLRPHRVIPGTPLGRSDYQGMVSSFDALDELWSSLMREFRLTKTRIVVPREYLRSLGPGKGASFDPEQEIFTAVEAAADQPLQLNATQFQIRTEQHLAAMQAVWATIVRAAGLSADALGEQQDGAAMTAKQVGAKQSRTAATRQDKINYASPALRHILYVYQELGALYYATGCPAVDAELEWPDAATPDFLALAQTTQLLANAKAASTRTLVRMNHPDWTDAQVDEEVELITEESAAAAPPPLQDPGTYAGGPGDMPMKDRGDMPMKDGGPGDMPMKDGGDGGQEAD